MSWYRDAENSKDYTPPKVSEQKLDAGGNYVSAAPEAGAHVKPQFTGSNSP